MRTDRDGEVPEESEGPGDCALGEEAAQLEGDGGVRLSDGGYAGAGGHGHGEEEDGLPSHGVDHESYG